MMREEKKGKDRGRREGERAKEGGGACETAAALAL